MNWKLFEQYAAEHTAIANDYIDLSKHQKTLEKLDAKSNSGTTVLGRKAGTTRRTRQKKSGSRAWGVRGFQAKLANFIASSTKPVTINMLQTKYNVPKDRIMQTVESLVNKDLILKSGRYGYKSAEVH
jgi:S-adenosylmethionine:tRNA-ribosyltransferase-isomerase (queuine synthetase)